MKNADFSIFSVFSKDRNTIHPAEFADVIDRLPFDTALVSFMELPYNTQVKVFPYLDVLLQRKLVRSISQQRAAYLLNNLGSDDRINFFNGLSAIADIMDGNFVSLNITDTKGTAIHKFKDYDRVVMPVINNDNLLLGVITIDDIMDIAEQGDTAEIQKFGGVEDLDYP